MNNKTFLAYFFLIAPSGLCAAEAGAGALLAAAASVHVATAPSEADAKKGSAKNAQILALKEENDLCYLQLGPNDGLATISAAISTNVVVGLENVQKTKYYAARIDSQGNNWCMWPFDREHPGRKIAPGAEKFFAEAYGGARVNRAVIFFENMAREHARTGAEFLSETTEPRFVLADRIAEQALKRFHFDPIKLKLQLDALFENDRKKLAAEIEKLKQNKA